MKTNGQTDHGTYEQTPSRRFDLKTLELYKRSLRIGQQVKLVKRVDDEGNTIKKHILRGTIKEIHPHIAIVEYPTTVKRCGVGYGVIRRESFTLKELMIWNMGVTV